MLRSLVNAAARIQFLGLTTILVASLCQSGTAATLCVNPNGTHGCYSTISAAVGHANAGATITVGPGTYREDVVIGIPLVLIGAGANSTIIDATNLANGVFVDGFDHPGLSRVVVAGFTVENAQFEGILVVSATKVSVGYNDVKNNDASPGLLFTGAPTGCPGQPAFETDETGDCGGAIHLIGTSYSVVASNTVTGNADGLLISDETAASHHNLVINNNFTGNPLECGIVMGSHPPMGSTSPPFAPHYGIHDNTIAYNVSTGNGVQIGGAGVGLFSDGNGPGQVSANLVVGNTLIGNGLGGVTLHTHVGPGFFVPPDNMDGNQIIGNYIAKNLADQFDTATPGTVGININSGGGGSPVLGTVIAQNVITNEDVDIAINTPAPAEVDIHRNNLLGGNMGVADVCTYDNPGGLNPAGVDVCTGSIIDATKNYWGCSNGPGNPGCTTVSGSDILFSPWLSRLAGGNQH